jgi:hypothetical protein
LLQEGDAVKIIQVMLIIATPFTTTLLLPYTQLDQVTSYGRQPSPLSLIIDDPGAKAFMEQFIHDNPRFKSVSFDEIIATLEVELASFDKNTPRSHLFHFGRALKMITEGALTSAKGVLVILWAGRNCLVALSGRLLWVSGECAMELFQALAQRCKPPFL